jgi:PIN domain nuclease of toxin-antitoxin system
MGSEAVKVLLDTHAVLWAVSGDKRLSDAAREWTERDGPSLAISDMTLLEIAMLEAKGRIACADGLEETLRTIASNVSVLPIDAVIAAEAMTLDLPQGDPFDRVIVATARRHGLPLLTRDRAIGRSGLVRVIW